MGDIKVGVRVDAKGNLAQRVQKYERDFHSLEKRGSRTARHIRAAFERTNAVIDRGIDRLGGRYAALISGAGTALLLKGVGDLEERMVRLGISAGTSRDEVNKLKDQIYQTAAQEGIAVDPSQITAAVEEIMEKTGDLKFAKENIKNIGLALSATGADGVAIGGILAEAQKQGTKKSQEVLRFIDTLTEQGKAGAFTMAEIAALGPRVMAAYAQTGRTGLGANREMGAVLQVIRQGTGSSEQAATALEAVVRNLNDTTKIPKLKKLGIEVFDPKEAEKGKEVMRPLTELIAEIVTKTDGKATILGKIFDAEAMRALSASMAEFKRTNSVQALENFMQVAGDGTTIIKDSETAAKTFNASMRRVSTTAFSFADANLAGPVAALADALNDLDPEQVKEVLELVKTTAISVGAVILGIKALRAGMRGYQAVQGFRAGRGAAGKVGGALNGVGTQRVFVVNMPVGFGRGRAGRAGAAGRAGRDVTGYAPPISDQAVKRSRGAVVKNRFAGQAMRAGGMAGKALPLVGGALMIANEAMHLASLPEAKPIDYAESGTKLAVGFGSALAGAKLGAIAGSVVPGVGTLIGGGIGAVAGMGLGYLGDDLVSKIFDSWRDQKKEPQKVAVEVQVESDRPAEIKRVDAPQGAQVNTTIRRNFDLGNLDLMP